MAKATRKPRQSDEQKAVTEPHKPTGVEQALIAERQSIKGQRAPAPKVKSIQVKNDVAELHPDTKNHDLWIAGLGRAFGTVEPEFSKLMVNSVGNAVKSGKTVPEMAFNGTLAAMYALAPRDEIEGMLVLQMVAVHEASITMVRRLNHCETIDQQNSASNALTKLMRTYTAQMEALNRYRGKGQQKMTVEHIHVGEGGQAIVGNVQGGRGDGKN